MKNLKRKMAAMIAAAAMLTPCLAVSVMPSTAADISISNSNLNHTYTAYKIFTGTFSESGEFGDADWNPDIDSTGIVNALKGSAAFGTPNPFADVSSAIDVVDALSGISSDNEKLDAFATIVSANLNGISGESVTGNGDTATISGLDNGYYLIIDGGAAGEPTARFILEVSGGTVEINNKVSRPALDKVIVDGENDVEANTASIGDVINYKLTSAVPDMTGYNKYYFIVNDTLDAGLELDRDSFKVTVGGNELTLGEANGEDTDYYINYSGDGQSFELVFVNFKQYTADDEIIITYSAVLDDDADLTANGNKNTANLTYSNNPNFEYGDEDDRPDEPDSPGEGTPDEPTGDTPSEDVVTYSTKLEITKRAESETGPVLGGVKFTLAKEGGATLGEFETNTDGLLTFTGLGAGKYTLTETDTLDGYNTIAPIEFTIGPTYGDDNKTLTNWTSDNASVIFGTGSFNATIINKKGSQLPSTGGIGTTLFYIIGGVLVVGSSIVLITKKRMSSEDK